jgi:hypothetical protein
MNPSALHPDEAPGCLQDPNVRIQRELVTLRIHTVQITGQFWPALVVKRCSHQMKLGNSLVAG